MFGLIRRISSSIVPRPDRPWEEDATSNAPKIGQKRRRRSTDGDGFADESLSKRSRADTPLTQETEFGTAAASTATTSAITEGVKEVTKGVNDVELEDKSKTQETETAGNVQPESIPLPDDVAGELDDASSISSTPPPPEGEKKEQTEDEARTAASVVERDASAATTETETAVEAEGETEVPVNVKETLADEEPTPAPVKTINEPKEVDEPSKTTAVETK